VGIWTYPRSLRVWIINDGGVQKNSLKGEFLAQKNSSNGTVSGGKNAPKAELRSAMYSPNRRFVSLSLGLLAAGSQRCAAKGRNDTPPRPGGVGIDIGHGLLNRMVDTPPPHSPPTHLSPLLLYSCPLVMGAHGLGLLGGPCHLGCPCALSPCSPVLLVVERWVCVPLGLLGSLRGCEGACE